MGKIHKFTNKNGLGLYPVTISDAVAVTKNNKTLTTTLNDIDSSIYVTNSRCNEIDSSINNIRVNTLGGYKISVSSSAGQESNTIYFVI